MSFGDNNMELFCGKKGAEVLETQGCPKSTPLPLHGGINENSIQASTADQGSNPSTQREKNKNKIHIQGSFQF